MTFSCRLNPKVYRFHEVALQAREIDSLGGDFRFHLLRREFTVEGDPLAALSRYTFISSVERSPETIDTAERWILAKDHLAIGVQLWDNVATHLAYPFRGRMIPATASALVNYVVGDRGEATVLDPMCGGGTVPLEALLKGRDAVREAIGVEVVPYYAYIAAARLRGVAEGLRPEVLDRDEVARRRPDWVGGNPLTNIILAYGEFLSEKRRASLVARRLRLVAKAIDITLRRLREFGKTPGRWRIVNASATEIPLDEDSVDGAVTSPPYLSALNYAAENPIPPDFPDKGNPSLQIETHDLPTFHAMMRAVYAEVRRVLRPGGRIAVVVGNQRARGAPTNYVEWTAATLRDLGFEIEWMLEEAVSGSRAIKRDWIIAARLPER